MKTMGLGLFSSGFGFLAVTYIVWMFGTDDFAIFTIAAAKLSIILLGLEIVPSQFSIFKMQGDEAFSHSLANFYLTFGLLAAVGAAACETGGIIISKSWLILPYAFVSVTQRYIELKTQSSGFVEAFGWMPAMSGLLRLIFLAILGLPVLHLDPADAIWGSLCIGAALGQVYVLLRFSDLGEDLMKMGPAGSARQLVAVRSQYYPYILNSVLKRLKDTFLPIFCDLVIPSKAEIGRLLVFTRANEAVMLQTRMLEAFMVNRTVRENLHAARRRIFFMIAPTAQLAVVACALFLMYRAGITTEVVLLALLTSFFVYPYLLEMLWRNEALATFRPHQVTISLLAFLAGLTLPPLIAYSLGSLSISVMLGSYVLAQTIAAITYKLFPQKPADARTQSA
jgi:hypothetical protein